MARFAIIDAGRVTNIIEAEQDFADTIGAVPAGSAGIGWLWDGTDFAPPPPYVPSPEEQREAAKAQRAINVANIKVTTQAGNQFDGDEVAQGRMARAVVVMSALGPTATVNWVLADNTVIQATAAELTEALALAGAAQAALWVI